MSPARRSKPVAKTSAPSSTTTGEAAAVSAPGTPEELNEFFMRELAARGGASSDAAAPGQDVTHAAEDSAGPGVSTEAAKKVPAREGRRKQAAKARQKLEASDRKSSAIHMDGELATRLQILSKKLHKSQGDLVIMAVEAEWQGVTPTPTLVGGTLFAKRPVSKERPSGRDIRIFSYRIFDNEYEVIDKIAAERDWPNRREFLIACLKAFCDRNNIPEHPKQPTL